MVRTSEERSLLSDKPAQILNTVLILNDFSMQLLCTRDLPPPKAMPGVRARKEGSFIKGTLFTSCIQLCLQCFFSSVFLKPAVFVKQL